MLQNNPVIKTIFQKQLKQGRIKKCNDKINLRQIQLYKNSAGIFVNAYESVFNNICILYIDFEYNIINCCISQISQYTICYFCIFSTFSWIIRLITLKMTFIS